MRHESPTKAAAGASPLLIPGPKGLVMPRAVLGHSVKADTQDPKVILAELNKAVTELRAGYDDKLTALDKADVVNKERLDKIDNFVGEMQKLADDVNAKLAALAVGTAAETGASQSPEDRQYAKDFQAFFRGDKAAEQAVLAAQKTGVRAAMTRDSNPDGGLLAPIEWDRTITGKLKLISPMRQLAAVQNISTPGFTKIYTDRAIGSGWVGETAPRPNTSTPQFTALTFTTGEIYANPAASQTLLDDAFVDLDAWLGGEVETEFARQEGIAFLNGNGVNKPYGLLGYATGGAFAAQHPFGAIPVVNSGDAANLTVEGLIDLVYDLPKAYTGNARFAANRRAMKDVRSFKDANGQFLWQPSLQLGEPATILGFAAVEVPDMPDVAANALPIAFGDFQRTYLVIDRIGIRVLRDPYSSKPYVSFYTTKRVGGGVVNPEPMRFQRIAA